MRDRVWLDLPGITAILQERSTPAQGQAMQALPDFVVYIRHKSRMRCAPAVIEEQRIIT